MANPQVITVGANSYSLVAMPPSPAPKSITITMQDTVAVVDFAFTGQQGVQAFPGADWWEAQVSLPPMSRVQAAAWIAWLAQLRGQQCVFQLGEPSATKPQGIVRGIPLVDGSVETNNAPTTTVLFTKGWAAGAHRLLLPGDYLQIGYRFYQSLDLVNADASGNAQINIYPSIRETPADGTPIVLRNTKGLFRLADNARSFTRDVSQLYGMSFKCREVR